MKWNKLVAPVELWGLYCKISAEVTSTVFLLVLLLLLLLPLLLFWGPRVQSFMNLISLSIFLQNDIWSSETKNKQTKTKTTTKNQHKNKSKHNNNKKPFSHGSSWNSSSFIHKMGNTEVIMCRKIVISDLLWVIRIKVRVVSSEVTCTADDLVQLFLLHCHLFTGPKHSC